MSRLQENLRISAIAFSFLIAVVSASWVGAFAQEPNLTANHLVQKVLGNEVNAEAEDHSHWAYRLEKKKPHPEVDEVVETNQGNLKLPLSIDGQPVSPSQKREADERIRKSVRDPGLLHKEREDEDKDSHRSQHLLKMLPDAFNFTYVQKQKDLVELHFTPNPHFHPSSHEAEVFHSMEGDLWINPQQMRLVEISGYLIREVKFGLGLLGHLDKGGRFQVKQAEVAPGYWEMVLLDVNMKGKALFFKTIAVQEDRARTDFHQLPDNLNLAEAADILHKQAAVEKVSLERSAAVVPSR